MKRIPLVVCLALSVGSLAQADAELQTYLSAAVSKARESSQLPAVAALIQSHGKIEAESVSGVRAAGLREPATLKDRWHLGSCAMAMTATLMARLQEQGVLRFDETLQQFFPGIAPRMNAQLASVTLRQLLNHTAGLAPLADPKELPAFNAVLGSEKGVRAQRAAVAIHYLIRPPAGKPGEFAFSNLGYLIVAAIAEARTGESWEDLIRREIWKPLDIGTGGFGAPGRAQPRGHTRRNGTWVAFDPDDDGSDIPPALAPAGSVNMSLADWLKFAQDNLDGERGRGKLLKPESYRMLHTPSAGRYAMGWGVMLDKDGNPALLANTGSNGNWVAQIRILPREDEIFLAVINAGGPDAEAAIRELGKAVMERSQLAQAQ